MTGFGYSPMTGIITARLALFHGLLEQNISLTKEIVYLELFSRLAKYQCHNGSA